MFLMKFAKKQFAIPLTILILVGSVPAFAEVSDLSTNQQMFFLGDEILFTGMVDEGTTGLVTIVVRDSNDDFVLLSQTIIEYDNTFEKKVKISDKFITHGSYNATAFIKNMTAGAQTSFDVSTDETLFQYEEQSDKSENNSAEKSTPSENNVSPKNESKTNEKSQEATGSSSLADFVDPEKDPQYYLDRYYNEPAYKSWFDSNYPEMTIEDAVGYVEPATKQNLKEIIPDEIIPDAGAISSPTTTIEESTISGEMIQMGLAVGGLGVLLAAVYGVKIKADTNSLQITKNRDIIKKKLFGGILSNDPMAVLKNRLAKGEITIKEFNQLKKTLAKED